MRGRGYSLQTSMYWGRTQDSSLQEATRASWSSPQGCNLEGVARTKGARPEASSQVMVRIRDQLWRFQTVLQVGIKFWVIKLPCQLGQNQRQKSKRR